MTRRRTRKGAIPTRFVDAFHETECLTERSLALEGATLQRKWFKSSDRRHLAEALQKLLSYNSKGLEFLGVHPYLLGTDQSTSVAFRTTSYVGAIPMRAPDTGKQIGDFVVTPRFAGRDRYTDYIEILDLLEEDISPEVVDSMPLVSGHNFRPPLYLEAVRFLASLETVLAKSWKKFESVRTVLDSPVGSVDWNRYSADTFRVESRTRFPVRRNVLSQFHSEFSQLRYVFDICRRELLGPKTPMRVQSTVRSRVEFIGNKLWLHAPKATTQFRIRAADRPAIKQCKLQANRILNRNLLESTAWRVDFNDVFEKFVQYIFREVSKTLGGRFIANYRFPIRSSAPLSWGMSSLEPDGLYQRGDFALFVDAKYKSHLFNRSSPSALLKEDFRRDLHQVLAYIAFGKTGSTAGMLCYPSTVISVDHLRLHNPSNGITNQILLCGVPLQRAQLLESVNCVRKSVSELLANGGAV